MSQVRLLKVLSEALAIVNSHFWRRRLLLKKICVLGGLLFLCAVPGLVFAASGSIVSLQTIASNVAHTVVSLAKMLQAVALIAGIGFMMAAFFKFHQHKLNPTQVSISQGITLLLIGAGLTMFPVLIPTTGSTLLGTGAQVSHVSGSAIKNLIGGS